MNSDNNKNNPVLLVNLAQRFGGVDVRVFDTARALAEADRAYTVATIIGSPMHEQLHEAQLDFVAIDVAKFSPAMANVLGKIIHERNIGTVDAHNVQSWLWSSMAVKRTGNAKLITSVHLPSRRIPGGLKGRIEEQIVKKNWRAGSRFVTVSQEIADYLKAIGIEEEKTLLSYNSLRFDEIKSRGKRINIRAEAGWPQDSFVFASIGRLTHQKGLEYLLAALPPVFDHHPNARCLIVGDGKLRKILEDEARKAGILDKIFFAGYRKDIPSILASIDVFCLPSRGEGLPYALLEACAFSLPIVASNIDAIAELFTHEDTAMLTAPGDVAGLTQNLLWVAEDPNRTKSLGIRASEFVRRQLDPDIMTRETLAFYDQPTS